MLKRKLGAKGFSLVELMVVVAIIGILAAVAIPNFQRFQRKARQSEATSALGALHAAEQAFHGQWDNYTTDLVAAGWAPEGNFRYLIGFGAGAAWSGMAPPDYTAAAPVPANLSTAVAAVCIAGRCMDNSGWNMAVGALPGTVAGGTGPAATLTAGANGDVGGTLVDTWTINQGKVLTNTMDGTL
jgi:type IV pilus assembly protein PilA